MIGVLSDRFGRLPGLAAFLARPQADYVVMALAPTLGWLFVGRLISGITSSTVPTAFAYIADVAPKEKRPGAFGLIGAAFGIGFTLGPVVIGGLSAITIREWHFGWRLSVLAIGSTVSYSY